MGCIRVQFRNSNIEPFEFAQPLQTAVPSVEFVFVSPRLPFSLGLVLFMKARPLWPAGQLCCNKAASSGIFCSKFRFSSKLIRLCVQFYCLR
jgi:hypothetical protein